MSKSSWSVYTYGVRIKRRFVNGRFSNESDTIDITKDMEKTLEMTDINGRDGHDLRQDIIDYEIVQHIFEIFKLTVQMRNSLSELEDRDYDRLISPCSMKIIYFMIQLKQEMRYLKTQMLMVHIV